VAAPAQEGRSVNVGMSEYRKKSQSRIDLFTGSQLFFQSGIPASRSVRYSWSLVGPAQLKKVSKIQCPDIKTHARRGQTLKGTFLMTICSPWTDAHPQLKLSFFFNPFSSHHA
jgi:hypothetical protein